MNFFGLVTGVLAGVVFYPLFGPVGLILAAAAGALLDATGRRPQAFGSETSELVVQLYSLWGLLTGRADLTEAQSLFLRGIATQLRLGGPLARAAYLAFDGARESVHGRPWPELLARTSSTAREIAEEFFLDRQTLLWIYAASRRLAALGTVGPGLAELLDTLAQAFSIWDEVGGAGLGQGDPYEKAWKNFKPGSSVSPEAYATLGVSPEAGVDEIKKAYRTLVRRHHPDAHSHLPEGDAQKKKAAEQFLQVQQAYERVRRARNF